MIFILSEELLTFVLLVILSSSFCREMTFLLPSKITLRQRLDAYTHWRRLVENIGWANQNIGKA